MELSKRMLMVADLVPANSVCLDMGCDHGFVAIHLVQKGICPKVLATDLREGPLSAAKEHVEAMGLTDRIELRLSDGLQNVQKGEVDGMIAAGMGGKLMIRVLEEEMEKVHNMTYLVLQPQSDIPEVRTFLRQNGFQIQMEDMTYEDGKYYFAILAKVSSREQMYYDALFDRMEEQYFLHALDVAEGKAEHEWEGAMIPSREEIREKAYLLGDAFGAALILEHHDLLPSYLNWRDGIEEDILEKLPDSEECTLRKQEVLQTRQLINLAMKIYNS
ncbi:MAG: SAM-dependent methyltransferase [Lachnospiraceae bacterium]|nr:SAM-dependent methyltransferase [Lachnospiraceae bacterium]